MVVVSVSVVVSITAMSPFLMSAAYAVLVAGSRARMTGSLGPRLMLLITFWVLPLMAMTVPDSLVTQITLADSSTATSTGLVPAPVLMVPVTVLVATPMSASSAALGSAT